MSVVLEPPLTRSGVFLYGKPVREEALVTGPRYVRTGGMSRWHRARSGIRYSDGRIVYGLWCGGGFVSGEFLSADRVADDFPVCGTCEGRACGAGQDDWPGDGPDLLFSPRRLTPPKYCPASRKERVFEQVGTAVGRCLICGSLEPLRGMGGWHNPKYAITQHAPGPGLIPGCPFHAWNELAIYDGQAMCLCRVPRENP